MKKTTIRVSDAIAEDITPQYGTLGGAASRLMKTYYHIRYYAISEIKTLFSIDELEIIMLSWRVYNRDDYYWGVNMSILEEQIMKNLHLAGRDNEYELIVGKMRKLSNTLLFILDDWATSYGLRKRGNKIPLREFILMS